LEKKKEAFRREASGLLLQLRELMKKAGQRQEDAVPALKAELSEWLNTTGAKLAQSSSLPIWKQRLGKVGAAERLSQFMRKILTALRKRLRGQAEKLGIAAEEYGGSFRVVMKLAPEKPRMKIRLVPTGSATATKGDGGGAKV